MLFYNSFIFGFNTYPQIIIQLNYCFSKVLLSLMRIEEEIKLDYSDVLFRPKRSTLKSRKDVNLLRTYRFKYSKNEWSGIPIMAANMDGVGELSIAEKLNDHGMIHV